MIIKKPYAFLIKHFRWIHAILFAMLVFLAVKSVDIYTFFSDYASKHYYVMSSMLASEYINLTLFLVIIGVLLMCLLIYFILSIKDKDRKIYVFISLYYIILFVYYIYLLGVFQGLQKAGMSVESVRAVRDISMIISLPQIAFLFIILGRTLGFNLKQFEFKKDLEEMQIDIKDYEEVEVDFGKNTYIITRNIRKIFRLLKYFILENKFVVTIMASIIVLVAVLSVFLNIKVYNVKYNEEDSIIANNINYEILNTYITNKDINNNIITKDKKYILIKLLATNKTMYNYNLYRESFRLKVNDELLLPTFGYDNKFIDIGKTYTPFEIRSGIETQIVLVFELDKNNSSKEYILRIKNYDYGSFVDLENEYVNVIVKPKELIEKNNSGKDYLPINMLLNETILGNTRLIIKGYDVDNTFKETYEYCITENECNENIYIVRPITTSKGNTAVLKLRGTIELDSNLYISKYITSLADFISYFGKINYRYRGNYKTTSITKIPTKLDSSELSYIEVPSELLDADKIEIMLNIRGIKYTFVLK